MISIFLLSILYLNHVHGLLPRLEPLVQIEQGLVRGQTSTDGQYSTFLGIPYAQVDLENPFGPAHPHLGFGDAVFDANGGSFICPQSMGPASDDETLDCLRLNIYVPNNASSNNLLPVLVWIHGGVFAVGSAGEDTGVNFMRHDIVIVSINYRLGPYGFLCLDVPSVPGNQGLKDQHEALVWVRNNIAAFGGNPDDVTIAGQSAGAASGLLHLYSNKEKLYNKAIIQSGTPTIDVMYINGDIDAAIKIAGYLGLNTTDTEEALDFLAKTPHNLVTGAVKSLDMILLSCKERSFPGVENFADSDPYTMSNEGKIQNTPILIGYTDKEIPDVSSDEWLFIFGYDNYFSQDTFEAKITKNFDLDDDQLEEAAKFIRQFYLGDEPATENVSTDLEIFESDFIFNHPVERTITNLLKDNANPIYKYLFSYTGNASVVGAPHSAEIRFLFDANEIWGPQSDDDRLISNRIVTLWANFVKYGNPTPTATDLVPVVWEPVTTDTRPYLRIDMDIRVQNRVFKENVAFWDLFYIIYERYHNFV